MRLLLSFLWFTSLLASSGAPPTSDIIPDPWLIGPLLAPAGRTVPQGHINWEPYLYLTRNYGTYNNHSQVLSENQNTLINPLLDLTIGLNRFMDLQMLPQIFYEHRDGGGDAWRWGDLPVGLGFQLLVGEKNTYKPDIRLYIEETFPTGQYKRLNPHKHRADVSGHGAYRTKIQAIFQNLYYVLKTHWFRYRLALSGSFSSTAHVSGFHVYGGGYGTSGTIHPGAGCSGIFSFELSLSKHWVFANDFSYEYRAPSSFSGRAGTTKNGEIANNTVPHSASFSLAPAVEYNFNENLGLIFGPWFSFAGANQPAFVSFVFALNYYQ